MTAHEIQHLDIEVTRKELHRAALLADAFVKAFVVRGWPVTLGPGGRYHRSFVTVLGQRVAFGVRERIARVKNPPPEPARRRDGSMYTPSQMPTHAEATGRLAFVLRVSDERSRAIIGWWDDTPRERAEDQINDFLVAIVRVAHNYIEEEKRRREDEQRFAYERR